MLGRRRGGWPLRIARVVAVGAACAAALGLLGGFHPAFDSLAHFHAHLAGLAIGFGLPAFLLWALARRRGRVGARKADGLAAALVGAVLLWPVLPFLTPQPPAARAIEGERRYTLLQMNLRFNAQPRATLDRIREVRPDIVTVQEVTGPWRRHLDELADLYPHRFFCRQGYSVGNTAILSRHPFAGPAVPCSPRNGFSAQAVDLEGRRVTVVAQHLQWPWPYGQWRQIRQLDQPLAGLPRPIIVGGDFNAAPWSAAVRTYAASAGLEIAPGIGPTWLDRRLPHGLIAWIGLPIDNILHSPGIDGLAVERLAPTASDHLPVLVTFSVAAPR